MKKIIHAVAIKAPPDTVFDAVATRKGLAGWWTTKVEADERVGGMVRFTFLEDFHPEMEITVLERPRLVSWKCVGGHEPWADNTFEFAVGEKKGRSLLMFNQHYARELSDEVYGTYNFNWGYYLESLRLLCQDGKGMPYVP